MNVNAGAGCNWTSVSNAAWITVTGGANGTGSGTVNYTVAQNTGAARTGTITIAGQTFTVNQAGAASTLRKPADFDGDGKYDFGVFRPSDTNWYILRSSAGVLIQQFGANGDIPVETGYIPQ